MTKFYTDGSANPNPGNGGFAVIADDQPVILGSEKDSTNIRMEAKALIAAYGIAQAGDVIYTDSEFWVNVLTKWAHTWKNNGWTATKAAIEGDQSAYCGGNFSNSYITSPRLDLSDGGVLKFTYYNQYDVILFYD